MGDRMIKGPCKNCGKENYRLSASGPHYCPDCGGKERKLLRYYTYILGLPKTLFFNFKYLDFKQAVKLPIFISHKTLLLRTNGKVRINGAIRTAMVMLGWDCVGFFSKSNSVWDVGGTVLFNGPSFMGSGTKISVKPGGQLIFGRNFNISAGVEIFCANKIQFGDDCLLSWRTLIMDTDVHKVKTLERVVLNKDREIVIGNNVWIGCSCLILKGTKIDDGCVVGADSFLNKEIAGKNCIIGGRPAKVLKEAITWEM